MASLKNRKDQLLFQLKRWSAWLPDQPEKPVSSAWPNGHNLTASSETPDLGFLPQIQRRRLTPLARAAIAVAWDCCPSGHQIPTIFCSTHGETSVCFNLLEQIAARQDVSPTQFTLSVHSGIAAMFSILTNNHAPYVVIATNPENLTNALLEAYSFITETSEVLVVFYDQAIPEIYHPTTPTPSRLSALALYLDKPDPRASDTLSIHPSSHHLNKNDDVNAKLLENLIESICNGDLVIHTGRFCWKLDSHLHNNSLTC
ncbi:MAG TPA: hypothetical protein ENJ32_03360 [Crenotrichaceae bacterium]|nr:hypothetical protein [Crenotrichaceae bacterium]